VLFDRKFPAEEERNPFAASSSLEILSSSRIGFFVLVEEGFFFFSEMSALIEICLSFCKFTIKDEHS